MNLIDGKSLASSIRENVKRDIENTGIVARLGVLLVGDDPASHTYVSLKEKACADVGIETDIRRVPASMADEELLASSRNGMVMKKWMPS